MNLSELRALVEGDGFTKASFTSDQLSNEVYHQGPGVSNSGLVLLEKECPAMFKYVYLDGNREKPTAAMLLGIATHIAVLEPDTFEKRVVINPHSARSNIGKEFATKAREQGQIALDEEDYGRALGMRDAVLSNKIGQAFAECERELSLYAQFPATFVSPSGRESQKNTLVRCRLDGIFKGEVGPLGDRRPARFIYDLKTAGSLNDYYLQRQASEFRYDCQAALYSDMAKLFYDEEILFFFVFVRSTPPHWVRVQRADSMKLENGRFTYQRALRTYINCLESGEWPDYQKEDDCLELSSYRYEYDEGAY